MKNTHVYVHGAGNLGKAIIEVLLSQGISISPFITGQTKGVETISEKVFEKIDFQRFQQLQGNRHFTQPTHIVVTVPGNVLEEQIDQLLEFNTPLIICSTGYNEHLISSKAQQEGVSVLLAPNLALPIIDFWSRLDLLPTLTTGNIELEVSESHQSGKKDMSGTLIKTVQKLQKKGIECDFDLKKAQALYSPTEGCRLRNLSCIRNPDYQLDHYGVPEEFLKKHAFHTYYLIVRDKTNISTFSWLNYAFHTLSSLESYNQEKGINFIIRYDEGILEITHDICGRAIYGNGVITALSRLSDTQFEILYAEDLLF